MLCVYVTCSSKKEASKIVSELLRLKLIACANYFPVESAYMWKGKLQKSKEYAILAKTSEKQRLKIEFAVKHVHSYELPFIGFWKEDASEKLQMWVENETSSG